jgi:hypothetical protein
MSMQRSPLAFALWLCGACGAALAMTSSSPAFVALPSSMHGLVGTDVDAQCFVRMAALAHFLARDAQDSAQGQRVSRLIQAEAWSDVFKQRVLDAPASPRLSAVLQALQQQRDNRVHQAELQYCARRATGELGQMSLLTQLQVRARAEQAASQKLAELQEQLPDLADDDE